MNYLIQCCDAIIEQKDFSIIDGESKESLLSNKLFLLNKRYHQSLKAIKKEQLKLKDYIEDISHQLKHQLLLSVYKQNFYLKKIKIKNSMQ